MQCPCEPFGARLGKTWGRAQQEACRVTTQQSDAELFIHLPTLTKLASEPLLLQLLYVQESDDSQEEHEAELVSDNDEEEEEEEEDSEIETIGDQQDDDMEADFEDVPFEPAAGDLSEDMGPGDHAWCCSDMLHI